MKQLLTRLVCPDCRMVWRVSLLKAAPDRAIACPLCGNRHFDLDRSGDVTAVVIAPPPTEFRPARCSDGPGAGPAQFT